MRYLGPWKAGNVADLDVGIVGSFQISLLALHVVGRFADGDGGGNGGGEGGVSGRYPDGLGVPGTLWRRGSMDHDLGGGSRWNPP